MFRASLSLAIALMMTAAVQAEELFVSAAASLTDVMKDLGARFEKQSHLKVILNFGASSMLARQIEESAPADVFISADEAQMDRVARLIAPETRRDLLTNTLVVIVSKNSSLHLIKLDDLTKPEVTRIALADPKAVPAGIYAREVLTKAKLWENAEAKIVPVENVRAALAVVEAGNADAGFVYLTDAMTSNKVQIAFAMPKELAPKIVYPMALVANSAHPELARRFLTFLETDETAEVFRRFGFGIAP